MADRIEDILNLPNKGSVHATGTLSKLFLQILADLKIKLYNWDTLMINYLNDPINRIPKNSKDRASARGNLNKELARPEMTWKVFKKGLLFLGVVSMKLSVELMWKNRVTTNHGLVVNISRRLNEYEDTEQPDDTEDNTLNLIKLRLTTLLNEQPEGRIPPEIVKEINNLIRFTK